MKPKKIKKLRLNKTTLTDLTHSEKINAKGGIFTYTIEPFTCEVQTCFCPESFPMDTNCFACQP